MTILEHPEDLGRVPSGQPSSIWQLPELRKAYAEFDHVSVAGHQCQFGLDAPKPTRLLSDIISLAAFGYPGWPKFAQTTAIWGLCRGIVGTTTSSRRAASFREAATRPVR